MSINPIHQTELDEISELNLEEPETRQRYKITDLSSLSWAFRKIQAEQHKKAELAEFARREISRIQLWLQTETTPIDNAINFFQGLITEYAQEQKQADPAFKKQSTPYGGIGYKKQQNKWEWQDDKLLAQHFVPTEELEKLYELAADLELATEGLVRLKISLEPEKNAIKQFTLIPVTKDAPCPDCGPGTMGCPTCHDSKILTLPVGGEYQVLSPDGEILPGITVKEQAEKLDIKVGQ